MKFFVALIVALWGLFPVLAENYGQWDDQDPAITKWFQSLTQPDAYPASCCGKADAYWADSYESTPDGNYVAIITDERDDVPLMRRHLPVGTKIIVPKWKLKVDAGNPTGHGVIFLNQSVIDLLSDGKQHVFDAVKNEVDGIKFVFCYVVPGGS